MFALEKLADWWDTQKQESEKTLDSFVDEHPNLFGVAVAGSVKTAMDLGSGFVDVLRIGEGMKKGGWGYAEDGLRVVSLAGPIARVGRMGVTKFVPDVAGPLCARVTATQALRMTGTSHLASVEDMIKSLSGKLLTSMTDIEPELRQLGAKVTNLGQIKSLDHVKDLLNRNPKGVINFAVKWVKSGGEDIGKIAGHSVLAYRDWIGRVRFLDRTGVTFGTFEELEQATQRLHRTYHGIEKAVPHGSALHVANSTVVTATNGASAVAIETRSLMLTSISNAGRVFDDFRNRLAKSVHRQPPPTWR